MFSLASCHRFHFKTSKSFQFEGSLLFLISSFMNYSPPGMCSGLCFITPSCLTLHDPMDCSLPGSSVHGDSPGKNTEMSCYVFLLGICLTQGSNTGLHDWRGIFYNLSYHETQEYWNG